MELVSWTMAYNRMTTPYANKIRKTCLAGDFPTWLKKPSFFSSLDEDLNGILIITSGNIKLGDGRNTLDRIQIQEDSKSK